MKLIRNRILLKAFAVFFLLEILISTVVPAVSWALTAGPTSPEYSSFEPVDTTDMVNLLTGEMTYNMPVLEVPGPSGGYPMSLSYHAGVKTDQEASWVGLGFTLNPGAINRTVDGFADDNYNTRREQRDYWGGGETRTKTWTIGVNLPIRGLGISYNLAHTQDTYKGFSVSRKANVGYSYNNVNVGFSIGTDGVSVNANVAGENLMPRFGKRSTNNTGSLSIRRTSTDGGSAAFWFGSFAIKNFYTRYWSDQSDAIYSYGALYPGRVDDHDDHFVYTNGTRAEQSVDFAEFRSYSGDIYDLPEIHSGMQPGLTNPTTVADPSREAGGALPANDQYVVLGQGIGGMMEPVHFTNTPMHGQNSYFKNPISGVPMTYYPTIKYKSLRALPDKKVEFRFKNDFSNSLWMEWANLTGTTANDNIHLEGNSNIHAIADGYDDTGTQRKLAGSKDIQWFTTEEIRSGGAKSKGFIDTYADPLQRTRFMPIYTDYLQPESCLPVAWEDVHGKGGGIFTQDTYPTNLKNTYNAAHRYPSLKPRIVDLNRRIGGFMVTNESGVTYHYALPVYSYNEYTRTKMKKPLKGVATINEVKNEEPYAYTWLLTAVTGPDYVDRGGANGAPNGVLDDEDFGYWVKFDYGKWTDSYQWRTPHSGYLSDFESEYESFAYGIKELYYLDAIETKSHKALFVKSKRKDGKGVTSRLEGGSNPRQYKMWYMFNGSLTDDGYPNTPSGFGERATLEFSVSPVSTLKLDAIYLFNKKDLAAIPVTKAGGDKYDQAPISQPYFYPYAPFYAGEGYRHQDPWPYQAGKVTTIKPGEDGITVKYHNGDLVLDDEDIANLEKQGHAFKSKALKTVVFNTDYSLFDAAEPTWGVPNSYDYYSSSGKPCTEACSDPDLNFEWPSVPSSCYVPTPHCCNETRKDAFYAKYPLNSFLYSQVWNEGPCPDALADIKGGPVAYYRTGKLTLKKVEILGPNSERAMPPVTFAYAKNPGYNKDRYDLWGYYKSDYSTVTENGETFEGTRRITSLSAQNVDAWSLTEIGTPTGGKIKLEYEANTYDKSVYNKNTVFSIERINDVVPTTADDDFNIRLKEKGLDLTQFFSIGSVIPVTALFMTTNYTSVFFDENVTVTNVLPDQITVVSTNLSNARRSPAGYQRYFISGAVVSLGDNSTKPIGGIRVKAVRMAEFGGHERATEYKYTNGVTSYVPFNSVSVNFPTDIPFFNSLASQPDWDANKVKLTSDRASFQALLNTMYMPVLVFGREAPAPGVMYGRVDVQDSYDGKSADSYSAYTFKTFTEDMLTRERGTAPQQWDRVLTNDVASVGSILTERRYAKDFALLSETIYGYLWDDVDESFEPAMRALRQGTIEQIFNKHVTNKEYMATEINMPVYEILNSQKFIQLKRIDRPNPMTTITERNVKLDTETKTEFWEFDSYSGRPTKTLVKNGNNWVMTEVTPAYRIYEYSGMTEAQLSSGFRGMGLKLKNPFNKHMLTQETVARVYDANTDGTYSGLISADVQTWSNQIDVVYPDHSQSKEQQVWRKNANYVFVGDDTFPLTARGLYKLENQTNFTAWEKYADWETGAPAGWKFNKAATLYDVYSHVLEAVDENGLYTSTRMSADLLRQEALVTNGQYDEFAYSGFEEDRQFATADDILMLGDGMIDRSHEAHTGNATLSLAAGKRGLKADINVALDPRSLDGQLHVSFWLYGMNNPQVTVEFVDDPNGSTVKPYPIDWAAMKRSGPWYLCELDIPVGVDALHTELRKAVQVRLANNGSMPIYIDDFRAHRSDAPMISYLYNDHGLVSHVLDNNNIYTYYEYDAGGALTSVWQETLSLGTTTRVKVKEIKTRYHHEEN
ncbi:hypothetical protein [Dawidia soli]|uniref:Uncharacterized protein n=1 Tax=Dawidia soli TaxID=2782352 RepID=A0AAP2D8I0_9BACT|nr:hypothetical protein [Dawidia soli]MBT1686912.1 hypothetical protein [Dawidia soli]